MGGIVGTRERERGATPGGEPQAIKRPTRRWAETREGASRSALHLDLSPVAP